VDLEGIPVETVLARIRDDDTEALAVLYRALFPSLWRLAMLRAGSTALAEEMVHDVFLALWLRRGHLATNVDIHVYLAVAVRNRARDWHAHARVIRATEDAVTHALQDPPAINQGSAPPDVIAESHEFVAAYQRALTALSDREREAAVLRWEDGLSFEQIAVVLGLSKNGVRKILLRAQTRVQADLAAYRD
jgi:RNA polymerase sigma-70 factor (ECF subfamily)